MDKEATVARFLAISELYFKITEQTEKVVSDDEIELLIASVDNSNLSMLCTNQTFMVNG